MGCDKQLKIKLSLIYVPFPFQTPTTTKTAEEYTELTQVVPGDVEVKECGNNFEEGLADKTLGSAHILAINKSLTIELILLLRDFV